MDVVIGEPMSRRCRFGSICLLAEPSSYRAAMGGKISGFTVCALAALMGSCYPEANDWSQRMRKSGALQIAEILRDEIISLTIKPGETIVRSQLQERFGASSTPVSDALLLLQADRLVEIFPQHATKVTLIDTEEASRDRFLRRALELEVGRTLASGSQANIAALRTNLALQKAVVDINQIEEFDRLDISFHRMLFDQVDMLDLWHLCRRRNGHLDRIRRLNLPMRGKVEEIYIDHVRIVDAIEARDSASVQDIIGDHISRSLKIAAVLADMHPTYFKKSD